MTMVTSVFVFAKNAIGAVLNVMVEGSAGFLIAVPYHKIWTILIVRHFDFFG